MSVSAVFDGGVFKVTDAFPLLALLELAETGFFAFLLLQQKGLEGFLRHRRALKHGLAKFPWAAFVSRFRFLWGPIGGKRETEVRRSDRSPCECLISNRVNCPGKSGLLKQ